MRMSSLSRTSAFIALAAVVYATPAAVAQDYTQEQAEACTPDALKYCSNDITDIPRVTACIEANFARLSPRCQAAVAAAQPEAMPRAVPEPAPAPAASLAPPPGPAPVPQQAAAAPPPPAAVAPPAAAPVAAAAAKRRPRRVARRAPPPAVTAQPNLFALPAGQPNLFAPTFPREAEAPSPRYRHHVRARYARRSRDKREARVALHRACATKYVSADLCRFTAHLIDISR